jgi:hypothetical protein
MFSTYGPGRATLNGKTTGGLIDQVACRRSGISDYR